MRSRLPKRISNLVVSDNTFEIKGSLVVSAHDIDGSILAVDLVDLSGTHYLVADNLNGERLLRHVGEQVSITGRLIQERAMTILEVDKYRLGTG